MADAPYQGFRFIGTEIENLIARIEKERERVRTSAQTVKALDDAISKLKECSQAIQHGHFEPTWFMLR
jgi:hypothetical protein